MSNVPSPGENEREGTSTKSWHESCYVTSRFCMEIYNGFLLDKGGKQYFREFLLAEIYLPRFHE